MLIKLKSESEKDKRHLRSYLEKKSRNFKIKFAFSCAEAIFTDKTEAASLAPKLEALDFVEEIYLSIEENVPFLISLKSGGKKGFLIVAGPCAVENEETYIKTVKILRKWGIVYIRGALYKPRRSPHTFQGLKELGVPLVEKARKRYGGEFVTEILSENDIKKMSRVFDVFQVGARNMRNYSLLRSLGKTGKKIILKRARGASLDEWLMSAEYLVKEGARDIVLCERGDAGPGAKDSGINFNIAMKAGNISGLPVIVDVTHSSGGPEYSFRSALATKAAGLGGFMIETHISPKDAYVDGKYALPLKKFRDLIKTLDV